MINLLYAGNDYVFDGVLLSLLSIVKKTKSPLNVYLLTMDLREMKESYQPFSPSHIDYLNKMLKEYHKESKVTVLDTTALYKSEMLDGVNKENFYTPYCLLRLFADEFSLPERIIYLDTDTLAYGDIEELFKIDITGYEFAGVVDYLGKWFIDISYINSGVLYLNMKEIKKTGLFKHARELCRNKKMAFPDQTALNKLVVNKLIIARKFNEQRRLKKETIIQHFCKSIRFIPFYHTLNVKPWEIDRVHQKLKITAYDDLFMDYQQRKGELV